MSVSSNDKEDPTLAAPDAAEPETAVSMAAESAENAESSRARRERRERGGVDRSE
jgi:hypothetical protein